MNIIINDVNYNVSVTGNGPPIILLHGFTGDSTTWNPLISYLNGSYKVISVDIIGHGQTDSPSDMSRYKMEHVSYDLMLLMEKMSINKAHILGYSMGGRLALSFAMFYPEKVISLILESSSPGLKTLGEREERKKSDALLANMIEEQGIESFIYYWEDISLFSTQKQLSKEKQKQIRNQRLANNKNGLANSLKGMGTGSQPSWWDQLERFNKPVKLICGEADEKFCDIAKEMELKFPDCQLTIVPKAGHAIHVEVSEIFGTIVREFLSAT